MKADTEDNSCVLRFAGGLRIVVPDDIGSATNYILREQADWFEDEIRFTRLFLEAGMHFVDVGASYGTYTLSAARAVGLKGKVTSFEPISATADLLRRSIELNRFGNVTVHEAAAADRVGEGFIAADTEPELSALRSTAAGSARINLTTLDATVNGDIDLIKIDAEGAESAVVRGGQELFSTRSPLVQLEIRAGRGCDLTALQELAMLGYSAFRLVPGLMVLVPFDPEAEEPDGYVLNLFCAKTDRADDLSRRGLLVNEDALATDDSSDWLEVYAVSQQAHRPAEQRLSGLRRAFSLLSGREHDSIVDAASRARVAAELGLRSTAVEHLGSVIDRLAANEWPDLEKPYLIPSKRFENIAPKMPRVSWFTAAVYDAFDRLASHSSYYSVESSIQRMEYIKRLGYANRELSRRLRLARELRDRW